MQERNHGIKIKDDVIETKSYGPIRIHSKSSATRGLQRYLKAYVAIHIIMYSTTSHHAV
jgi:hypothetical protein